MATLTDPPSSYPAPSTSDPWVSDPSSSTARPSPSSSVATPPHRHLPCASQTIRPNLRPLPSADNAATLWAQSDPLSSNTPTHHVAMDIEAVTKSSDSPEQTTTSPLTSDFVAAPLPPPSHTMVTTQLDDNQQSATSNAPQTSPTEEPSLSPEAVDSIPSPPTTAIDYNQLHALCASGNLDALKAAFEQATEALQVSAFTLANTPNPTSGLAAIHYAAKEGRLDVLKWLMQDVGALAGIEDREGETALHKAAMFGKLPALTYLLSSPSLEADVTDADGWTALHNACSKGYLDIVRFLVETAKASIDVKGGRGGWTPLMNAVSNGHLPIVRYLTVKCRADPFIRNLSGETAYDVAAAKFEIYICQVLEMYEAQRWPLSRAPGGSLQAYNPLRLHLTIPVLIHQNERLDTRLSTLAIHGGKPRWSGTRSGLPGKPDRRAPGTMPPGPLSLSKTRVIPMRREDVQLPLVKDPYKIRLPSRRPSSVAANAVAQRALTGVSPSEADDLASTPTPESVLNQNRVPPDELSHFWFSGWQVDCTHPQVDPAEGWQYAQSFHTPEEDWSATTPPPLERLLEGKGLGAAITRALAGPAARIGNGGDDDAVPTGWVRRRRWVRVMRRRLDIQFSDELEAAENESAASAENGIDTIGSSAARQAQSDCDRLPPTASYVERAQTLAGFDLQLDVLLANAPDDPQAVEDQIVRLDMALGELRSNAFDDDDADRQARAEELLKDYTLQVGQLRRAIGGDEDISSDDDDEDEEFIYPNSFKDTQSVITRIGTPKETSPTDGPGRRSPAARPSTSRHPSSSASSAFGDHISNFTIATNTRAVDLARASEFRVPTNEAPQSRTAFSSRPHTVLQPTSLLPTWELDENVQACRSCSRQFTFFTRKHHCRRCGRIFCASCSSHRAQLSADELVIDPAQPEMFLSESMGGYSRICGSCDAERQLPEALRSSSVRGLVASGAVNPGTYSPTSSSGTSHASQLNECPVCNTTLATLGGQSQQEVHVQACLETGGGGGAASVQTGRYLIYRLPGDSPIMGRECVICLEELDLGQMIARLPCLCFFHRNCIDSWLARGRSCPTHAR